MFENKFQPFKNDFEMLKTEHAWMCKMNIETLYERMEHQVKGRKDG
jgi:cystathionine beta-lyase/cystathionine gamma-synthase